MKKTCLIFSTLTVSMIIATTVARACSNVFVSGPGVAAVGRTTDLNFSTGYKMGYGGHGWSNISNINVPQQGVVNAMKWINQYSFLGETALGTYVLTDGINDQGLYAGFLDLPDFSRYPAYNAKDPRPELGITDLINYVLGTSKDVPEALMNLKKAQIIENTFAIVVKNKTYFGGLAIHLVLRDKQGNAGVVEWTMYKGKPTMHTYFHQYGTNYTAEYIAGTKKKIIFRKTLASAVTNSPTYDWQLQNASKYNYVFTGSTKRQWDGAYMNGSGMYNIPGSWTPPARLSRAMQLVRLMPTPKTEAQAMTLAWNALETMKVPAGANPVASIWASMSDLKNSVYYVKELLSPDPNFSQHVIKISLPAFNSPWQEYRLTDYTAKNSVPEGWVSAQVKQSKLATAAEVAQANKMFYAPTPGGVKTKIEFK